MTFVSTKLDHRNFLIHCNYQIKCSILQIFSLALLVCVSYDNTALLSACISPLRPNVAYLQRETFSFMMSHPAMSLRDRLCASREGGAGGGGWVHPKGANSMAAFGLSFERPLVGAG